MTSGEYLYRYEETRWSLGCDEYDDPLPGFRLSVDLLQYKVIKRTPKGAWIVRYWSALNELGTQRRFVNLTAKKKFACETPEEAKESFLARKRRQVKILKGQLRQAEAAIWIVSENRMLPMTLR